MNLLNTKQPKQKIIVIIYASIGSGHKMAAIALEEAFNNMHSKYRIELIDILDFSSSEIIKILSSNLSINSKLVGAIYNMFWGKVNVGNMAKKTVNLVLNNYSNLEKHLIKTGPEVVICTHALPSVLVSEYLHRKVLECRHYSVLTDFRSNQVWPVTGVDHYFVPSLPAKTDLIKNGVVSNKITISGIPLREQFATRLIKKQTYNNHKTPEKILLITGSENGAPYKFIVNKTEEIIRVTLPFISKLTVVCGNNVQLAESLKKKFKQKIADKTIKILGYVINIAKLIEQHDLVISKPGGLISSEIICLHKPLIIYDESYGQERANTDYLVNNGLAIMVKGQRELKSVFESFSDYSFYGALTKNFGHIATKSASNSIAQKIISGTFRI